MLRIRRQVSRNHRQVFQESPSNVVGFAVKCARILHPGTFTLREDVLFYDGAIVDGRTLAIETSAYRTVHGGPGRQDDHNGEENDPDRQ